MKKKINHPSLIWLVALVSLFLNSLVLFSTQQLFAKDETKTIHTNNSNSQKGTVSEPVIITVPELTPTPKAISLPASLPMATATPTAVSNEKTSSQKKTTATGELTPKFNFSLSNGDKIEGDAKVSGKVDGATAVEFYLIKKGSINPEYYVGSGKSSGEKQWEAVLHSKQFPNGQYEIFAKIKNVYGSYKSDKVAISIDNLVVTTTTKTTKKTTDSVSETITKNNSVVPTATPTSGINNQSAQNNRKNSRTTNLIPTATPPLATTTATEEINLVYEKEKAVESNAFLSTEEKTTQLAELQVKKAEIKKEFVSRQEAERIVIKSPAKMTKEEKEKLAKIREQFKEDSDGDGLPDFEEERIGTDVFSADTDKDGYLDGDEVARGFDPLKASTGDKSDKIVFEEPKDKGTVSPAYEVASVSYEKKTEKNEQGSDTEKEGIKLQGKALPNSFVTLYVYSSAPIVVTVQADENGSWEYFLDKELEDGDHQVYATVTDNTGKITSKSETFSFVKTAKAVEATDGQSQVADALQKNASPLQRTQVKLAKFILIFSFLSFFLAVGSIALFVKHREFFKKKIEELKSHE